MVSLIAPGKQGHERSDAEARKHDSRDCATRQRALALDVQSRRSTALPVTDILRTTAPNATLPLARLASVTSMRCKLRHACVHKKSQSEDKGRGEKWRLEHLVATAFKLIQHHQSPSNEQHSERVHKARELPSTLRNVRQQKISSSGG